LEVNPSRADALGRAEQDGGFLFRKRRRRDGNDESEGKKQLVHERCSDWEMCLGEIRLARGVMGR
jgi:hypothetical protein